MTTSLKYLSVAVVGGLIAIAAFGFFLTAHANPSFFIRSGTTATTSPIGFITPGLATTTIPSFDLGVGGAQGADSVILALQFTGSTTPNNAAIATTTFKVIVEQSQNNVDWYSDSSFATTTVLGWETINGVLIASSSPTKFAIPVSAAMRYVRANVSIPLGSTNGSVWAEFIAKRQNP